MKTKISLKNFITTPVMLFLALLSFNLHAATVNLDSYWNGSAGNLAAAFTQAENAAGNGGTIKLASKTYSTSKTITIKKSVTIQGAGKTSTVVKATSSITNGVFQITANNVTIKALTVNSNGLAKHGIRTGFNNIATASKNLRCVSLKVLNHKSQGLFPGHGNALNGLYVDGCDFHSNYDNAYPHIFISNRNWSVRKMYSIDPFTIKNSTFSGRGEGGLHAANSIEFDGGNDNVNIVTDLKGSLVTGCTFEKTAKWQISWVECINVSVTNCVFKGTLGVQSFAQPIHLEQFCKNIRIEGNRIHQNNSNSDHIWAGGSDYGTPVAGPSNCIIRNNIFTGTARHGYFDGISTSANGNIIEGNDFTGASFAKEAVKIKGSNNKVICNKGLTASKVNLYGGSNNTFTPWTSSCGGTNPPAGDKASFQLVGNNQYISSQDANKLECNKTSVGTTEKFTIVDAGGGKVALKGSNGKYVSSENGNKQMSCNRGAIGAWEKFEMISYGNDVYALKGNNGKYVKGNMFCTNTTVSDWQKFRVNRGLKSASEVIISDNQGLQVFPNPASLSLNINVQGALKHVNVHLFNSNGVQVLSHLVATNTEHQLDISGLARGIYLVKAGKSIQRVIIK